MSIRVIDLRTRQGKKEHKQLHDSLARAWRDNAVQAIHRHAEFRFTSDGKFYSMVPNSDTIGHLMNAVDGPDFKKDQHVWSELRSIAGAIVVCEGDDIWGLDGQFLPFNDLSELIDAWHELHKSSRVQMSELDQEKLDELDPRSDEEDED